MDIFTYIIKLCLCNQIFCAMVFATIVSYLEGFWKRYLVGLLLFICIIYGCSSFLLTWFISTLSLWACRTVKINDINCMQSIWLISTNTRFLSFFLFHAPSFILLLYCTFEFKSHDMKFASFQYKPYAICEMLLSLWFFLVLVQLYADRLSRSPARPSPHSSSYLLQQTYTGTNMGQL